MTGVSFVVPVHNGASCLRATLDAIVAQADGRPLEIIVVEDRSRDGSADLLRRLPEGWPVRVLSGPGRGAAAALNMGIAAARYPIVCQVDQDVVLRMGWMTRLVAELDDPHVAAAQGYYETDPGAPFLARLMGLDLEARYAAIDGPETTHVCTGNVAYRTDALRRAGPFDETMGYGYDNDMSYRLRRAGHRLVLCRGARSRHQWRKGLAGYVTQQYGFGYGRLDVVRRHPSRWTGDSVSPAAMMLHPLLMALAVVAFAGALLLAAAGGLWRGSLAVAIAIVVALAAERAVAGVRAAARFRSLVPLAFPAAHLARDMAWVAAISVWTGRRLRGREFSPAHSMRPRSLAAQAAAPAVAASERVSRRLPPPTKVLGVIPAHNEAANLPAVVAEVRACMPDLDLLVIDDGSTDGTDVVLQALGVRWLRFPERMGIGGAMRAGLRYAARLGYDAAVRIDGDGQHRAEDIEPLLMPIREGVADAVLGSRFATPGRERTGIVRAIQRLLGACISAQTGRRVTDPTSGFCAFGPRAVRLLAEYHPTGYPEPELRLFLSRNALRAVEVPVQARRRLAGTSSLTAVRLAAAGARVMLAMIIVPLQCVVGGARRD